MSQPDSEKKGKPQKAQKGVGRSQGKLDATRSQLLVYANDLKGMLEQEEQRAEQLRKAQAQTLAYAQDLKLALAAEQHKNRELEQAYTDTILRLAKASRYKDEETGAHIERLSHYARSLALFIGWQPSRAQWLFTVAPMHDVGKIGIPDALLSKKGPLNEQEWDVVRQHPLLGASLLEGSCSPLLEMAKEVALTHHERWDGTGYPRGLRGNQIPITGRIVMLCDLYDALRSRRPYKPAFSHSKACDVMFNGGGRTKPSHFDPRLLEAFRELHGEFDRIYSTVLEEETMA